MSRHEMKIHGFALLAESTKHEPTSLPEALLIISYLRRRLAAFQQDVVPQEIPPGFRPQVWNLYNFLRDKGYASKRDLYGFLWGSGLRSTKSLQVCIFSLRKMLPPDEEIVSHRGKGYEWRIREGRQVHAS